MEDNSKSAQWAWRAVDPEKCVMKGYLEKQGSELEMNRTGLYLLTQYFKSIRACIRAQSLHDVDTGDRPETLGNFDYIPGKERLVSSVSQQAPTNA